MKKLLVLALGFMLSACGDDAVRIDERGSMFFGSLQLNALMDSNQFIYASVMLSDSRGRGDFKTASLNISARKNEGNCLNTTGISINGEKVQSTSSKLEVDDKDSSISYVAKYQFEQYLEFFAKDNKVTITSCGVEHTLTPDEKKGLAKITEEWIKFMDKK